MKNVKRKGAGLIFICLCCGVALIMTIACVFFFFNNHEFIQLENWMVTSGIMNNGVIVDYYDDSVDCKLTTENGTLIASGYENPVKEILVKVKQEVNWISWRENFEESVETDFISILLLKKSKVVAYGVLEITRGHSDTDCKAEIIERKILLIPISEGECLDRIKKIIKN